MVVYWGTVDQIFITIMTLRAKSGFSRKLIPPPTGRIPARISIILIGPVTLNMNMKMMVSAELEVRVGRK